MCRLCIRGGGFAICMAGWEALNRHVYISSDLTELKHMCKKHIAGYILTTLFHEWLRRSYGQPSLDICMSIYIAIEMNGWSVLGPVYSR